MEHFCWREKRKKTKTMSEIEDRYTQRKIRNEAQKGRLKKILGNIKRFVLSIKNKVAPTEEHIYVKKFKGLRCAEDLVSVSGNVYNNHNKINIMALWSFFQSRNSNNFKNIVKDKTVKCVANTLRLFFFLRFMTKWQVELSQHVWDKIRCSERTGSEYPVYDYGFLLNPEIRLIHNIKEYCVDIYALTNEVGLVSIGDTEHKASQLDINLKEPNNILVQIQYR